MTFKLRNPRDFCCGLAFLGLGILAVRLAQDYPMGTALGMGPGYFPTWLGYIMMAFGVVIGALGFKVEREAGAGLGWRDWALRPWLVTTAAIAVYALLMDAEVGFVPSLLALVIGSALAHEDVRWLETLLLAVGVSAAAVAIFVYGIGLPYKLFWWSE
jgi:hypothetical protein